MAEPVNIHTGPNTQGEPAPTPSFVAMILSPASTGTRSAIPGTIRERNYYPYRFCFRTRYFLRQFTTGNGMERFNAV